jgi:hypothetical protein
LPTLTDFIGCCFVFPAWFYGCLVYPNWFYWVLFCLPCLIL